MPDIIKCPEQFVFGLDIGTRSIVGTVGYMDSKGFHVIAMEVKEHDTRAMYDGQVHDIGKVTEEIMLVKSALEKKTGRPLVNVCIAAAGRVLRTITVRADMEFEDEHRITAEDIYNIDFAGVELAHRRINDNEKNADFYCVGYTPVKYYINDYEIGNLEGHKGSRASVDLLATFLPEEVVDGLYAAVEGAGLEVANLTLEPIAAMNVAIPEQYRLLNIALLDVGAGTSDICITRDGSIVAYGMIPYAGDEISEMIARHYLVDFARAEKIKVSAGKAGRKINFKDIMGTRVSVTSGDVIEIIMPVIDRIAQDVADKIVELNGGKAVSAVFVVGGGGKIPGFTGALADKLGIPSERVALRGKEVLGNVEFAIDNFKKDSLFVTPVGICVNYYSQKNNFIFVTVNGERVKLYDNNGLTVTDALMQAGYPNEKLFPRRGAPVNFTLNGAARMVRGESGEPARIFKNGKETGMNSRIEKNDYIDIEESTVGAAGTVAIGSLPEFRESIDFMINGRKVSCPKFAYVNGELKNGSYVVRENDKIVMENYYTLGQLFEFLDIRLDTVEVTVNNEQADIDTKVYENFNVKYTETPLEKENSDDEEDFPETGAAENRIQENRIQISVNKTAVTLKNKPSYKFVDVLDFYPFDLSKMGGKELYMAVNGIKAGFSEPLKDGDSVDLYWTGEPPA